MPMVCAGYPPFAFRCFLRYGIRNPKPAIPNPTRFASASPIRSFQWDEALRIAEDEDSSDLSGFFQRVRDCNRGSELKSDFVPFVVEDEIVGYIHNGFINHLKKFEDVFSIELSGNGSLVGGHVMLNSSLETSEERTNAVGDVVKHLGPLIPGIRNELYPVTSSFGMPIFFSLERAAAQYFGIKAYGVHMNGYVERDGRKFLWIGKRSNMKPTYPGMLDHLVAGGLPHGISCQENLIKECEEEAGIPRSISSNAIPVGAISYMDIDGYRYKRDVLFCYDLKLPADFAPKNEDHGARDRFGSDRRSSAQLILSAVSNSCSGPFLNPSGDDFVSDEAQFIPEASQKDCQAEILWILHEARTSEEGLQDEAWFMPDLWGSRAPDGSVSKMDSQIQGEEN